ncbi:XIAP-associated factor 1 [Austrofundulus limnaeus]|uniref:XIAP-associated factor 1 n=1 Tax=Austrofundulus limnaeus TaxID=52670 RepID=A0A2I4CGL6_AUSLI|nr:PREDICTED: XIAP-associated factor 1 [Austrofundulus limnaeus]
MWRTTESGAQRVSLSVLVKRKNSPAMDDKEATQTCMKCHKEVAEANFALHETHCNRFLCLCPDCNESVPRDQLSQHREEQHTQVRCSKCNKKMERCHLMDHESEECVERLHKCPFCELEVPWKELQEHSLVCGSRTELCRDCGRYVQLRDQPDHSCTRSAPDDSQGPPQAAGAGHDTKPPVSCSTCLGSFPAEDFVKHQEECFPAKRFVNEEDEREEEEEESEDFTQRSSPQLSSAYRATSLIHSASRGPGSDGGNPEQISTCPHCHLALPLQTLTWHEVKCRTHIFLKYREA